MHKFSVIIAGITIRGLTSPRSPANPANRETSVSGYGFRNPSLCPKTYQRVLANREMCIGVVVILVAAL